MIVRALADSGATLSVFRPEIGGALGIAMKRGIPITLEGIGGRILGYRHTLSAAIAEYRFSLPVVFSYELRVSLNILGRAGFFEEFRIVFNERARRVVVER